MQPFVGNLACRPAVAFGSIPDHAKFFAGLAFENFFAGIAPDHDPIVLAVDHGSALLPLRRLVGARIRRIEPLIDKFPDHFGPRRGQSGLSLAVPATR